MDGSSEERYRLSSHEDADEDGMATRFICRFKPSMETTLSVYNVDYDYNTFRKGYKSTFTEEGFDNHMIWSSQLFFQCPVPVSLQETVRLGTSVKNDYATLFLDLIPIRTPPNYGAPASFLQPKYGKKPQFIADQEWGKEHILPKIEDSGRFENIPICKSSLMTYPDEFEILDDSDQKTIAKIDQDVAALGDTKKHQLIACTWASTSFQTRGGRTTINDGDQRLLEWTEFNKMIGVDHIYIFDNSGSFSGTASLKPITDLYPGYVTRINWPAKVCNNNKSGGKLQNKGERSSQYAAESACRLRFGAHSEWLMSVDTDEYLVPLGNHTELKSLLNEMKEEDTRILQFKSKRAKIRLDDISNNELIEDSNGCRKGCIDTSIPEGKTFLGVYNCDSELPVRRNTMPAEKQIYQPDYVKLHFVHYSAITTESQLSEKELLSDGKIFKHRYDESRVRFADEKVEGTMLHTKAYVTEETNDWSSKCSYLSGDSCKLGIPFPVDMEANKEKSVRVHVGKYANMTANCYAHVEIDDIWVPKLTKAIEERLSLKLNGKD